MDDILSGFTIEELEKVYPPCDNEELLGGELDDLSFGMSTDELQIIAEKIIRENNDWLSKLDDTDFEEMLREFFEDIKSVSGV